MTLVNAFRNLGRRDPGVIRRRVVLDGSAPRVVLKQQGFGFRILQIDEAPQSTRVRPILEDLGAADEPWPLAWDFECVPGTGAAIRFQGLEFTATSGGNEVFVEIYTTQKTVQVFGVDTLPFYCTMTRSQSTTVLSATTVLALDTSAGLPNQPGTFAERYSDPSIAAPTNRGAHWVTSRQGYWWSYIHSDHAAGTTNGGFEVFVFAGVPGVSTRTCVQSFRARDFSAGPSGGGFSAGFGTDMTFDGVPGNAAVGLAGVRCPVPPGHLGVIIRNDDTNAASADFDWKIGFCSHG